MRNLFFALFLTIMTPVLAAGSVGMNTNQAVSSTIKTLKDVEEAQYCIQATVDSGSIGTALTVRINDALSRISKEGNFGLKVLSSDTAMSGTDLIRCLTLRKIDYPSYPM